MKMKIAISNTRENGKSIEILRALETYEAMRLWFEETFIPACEESTLLQWLLVDVVNDLNSRVTEVAQRYETPEFPGHGYQDGDPS